MNYRYRTARVSKRSIQTLFAAVLLATSAFAQGITQAYKEPPHDSGQAITAAYEGWYPNPDGSNTILIGYYNRNIKQVLDIPIGLNNRVDPGGPDRGQPTHFIPGRQWGVFSITVPKDFGAEKKLTWTIVANGKTTAIPFSLNPLWIISPFKDATSNTPPFIAFQDTGPFLQGPPRAVGNTLTTALADAVPLAVWVADDAHIPPSLARFAKMLPTVSVTWSKFRGPGDVKFANEKPKVEKTEFQPPPGATYTGKAATTATFSEPGEYLLEVTANDLSGVGGGGFQCCWTTAQVKVTVQPQASGHATAIPSAPDRHPDLQGIWTNATLSPLERPADLAGKATLTDAEAKAYEKKDLQSNTLDSDVESNFNKATGGPGVGAYNNLFVDRGSELARVDGLKRTSLIIDPPDGRIPPLTDAARERVAGLPRAFTRYDSVKDRPLSERCIIGFGSTSGPPMLPVLYNNNYEIVQTPDAVLIQVEMVHDRRVIRLNGTHKPANVHQLLGDSIGHWEGDTLVVETTNFTNKTRFRGSSENLHVIERFRRVDSNTLLYRATIDDPTTYTKPWTLEYPFLATAGPVYEYACHEGNYAMPDILGGARKLETEAGHN